MLPQIIYKVRIFITTVQGTMDLNRNSTADAGEGKVERTRVMSWERDLRVYSVLTRSKRAGTEQTKWRWHQLLTMVSRFLTAIVRRWLGNEGVEIFKRCWSTQVKADGNRHNYIGMSAASFLSLVKTQFLTSHAHCLLSHLCGKRLFHWGKILFSS